MSRRRTLAAALTAALVALCVAAPAGQAQAPRQFFGIVPQTGLNDATFQHMASAGVGTVRLRIDWGGIDRSKGGVDDFAVFDPLVLGAARNGIQVLPFLYGTPAWVARDLDGRPCDGAGCAAFAPRSGPALAAWQRFVAAAVDRYGANGTLWDEHPEVPRMPMEVWQIWNEQNSAVFYRPWPKPKGYMRMLRLAARSIRAHDPSATVLLGGMAELAGSKVAIDGSAFLRRLYRRPHAKRSFDAMGLHPYGVTMPRIRKQVRLVRKVMRRAHDNRLPMYITEVGAGSADGGHSFNIGFDGQATLLRQIYEYFESRRVQYDIRQVDWFAWQDLTAILCKWCPTAGLLTADGTEKPSYQAFAALSSTAAPRP